MPRLSLPVVLLIITVLSSCSSTSNIDVDDTADKVGRANGNGDGIRAFEDVITDDAESDPGLFVIHLLDNKVHYEIPDSLLGTELLLVSRLAATADKILYGGVKTNTQVVRWERQNDDILLRIVTFENVADEDEPIFQAVRNSNFEPIIRSFDIEAYNADTTGVVIDATSLFTEDVPVLGLPKTLREQYKVTSLDKERTFVTSSKSYPENIEVRHVLTYKASEPPSSASTGTISLEMNQSMILLPVQKMVPRLCDKRVGFFNMTLTDYGRDAQKAEERCYVTRWRLEPSDPDAYARGELVEPIKPIVYYIDPATPQKWRSYIKQGIEDWNRAFAHAGFRDAITAKDPPTPEEDPEFSPEDVRYSVVRYFSSPVQNAYGPHVHDPRTGEILESDIGWYHNVMNLLRNWFFVQTAAVNPDARDVKFKDDVMGRLVRFVAAHEVGHTLGLPHNWGSSYAYPIDSLRSKHFTDNHGTAPSIMDYARFNYVAQPEDGITNLIPDIGTYDEWAIKWGYTFFPDVGTPEEAHEILNEWVIDRAGDPVYFFGRQGPIIDPRAQREDLGDDAVRASDLGTANLKIIVQNLIQWTSEEGKNYDDLEELYGQVIRQWNLYVGHVTRNVGGWYETFKTFDQDGPVYEVVPEDRQREAMAWITREVFSTPKWLVAPDVLRRFEGIGIMEQLRRLQVGSLNQLLDHFRLSRMLETEAVSGSDTYTAEEMLHDVRDGVWTELGSGEAIDPFRRNLQRGHLERLEYLLSEEPPPPTPSLLSYGMEAIDASQSDVRALARGELEAIRESADAYRTRTADRMTRLHLNDVVARIDEILDKD